MLSTATPAPAGQKNAFDEFLNLAMQHGTSSRSQKRYALDHGVDEAALIRYANGAVSAYERSRVEEVVAVCDWARDYVVNYVKSKRVSRNAA